MGFSFLSRLKETKNILRLNHNKCPNHVSLFSPNIMEYVIKLKLKLKFFYVPSSALFVFDK